MKNMNIKEYTIEDYTDYNMEDDDLLYTLKKNISKLKEPEKILLLLYLNTGTYASIAKKYNVSKPTAKKYIMTLIKKLKIKVKNITV